MYIFALSGDFKKWMLLQLESKEWHERCKKGVQDHQTYPYLPTFLGQCPPFLKVNAS